MTLIAFTCDCGEKLLEIQGSAPSSVVIRCELKAKCPKCGLEKPYVQARNGRIEFDKPVPGAVSLNA